jgi:FixJ family two-component response regulator
MPGPGGFELHEGLRTRGVNLPVIFITGHGDIAMGVRAMKAGAVDFLTKPVERSALLSAGESALARSIANRADRRKRACWNERMESLTPREHQVMALVVAGHLNKQIAAELGASERTIKAHRANVMTKSSPDAASRRRPSIMVLKSFDFLTLNHRSFGKHSFRPGVILRGENRPSFHETISFFLFKKITPITRRERKL